MSKLTVNYRGLVVATVAIEPADAKDGDEVTFNKTSTGGKAVFLQKVKEYDNSGEFKAIYVSPEKAARHVELFPKLNKQRHNAAVCGARLQRSAVVDRRLGIKVDALYRRRSQVLSNSSALALQ